LEACRAETRPAGVLDRAKPAGRGRQSSAGTANMAAIIRAKLPSIQTVTSAMVICCPLGRAFFAAFTGLVVAAGVPVQRLPWLDRDRDKFASLLFATAV